MQIFKFFYIIFNNYDAIILNKSLNFLIKTDNFSTIKYIVLSTNNKNNLADILEVLVNKNINEFDNSNYKLLDNITFIKNKL